MKPAEFRIVSILAVIGLVACDCGWLRHVFTGRGSVLGFGEGDYGFSDFGVLVMLNVLAVSLIAARGRCRFLPIGFEIAGLAATLAYIAACRLFPESFLNDVVMTRIQRIHDSFMENLPPWAPDYDPNALYPAAILVPLTILYTVILTLPLLFVAVAGGLSFRLARGRSVGGPDRSCESPDRQPGREIASIPDA